MALTTVKMVVSMKNDSVTLTSHEYYPPAEAFAYSAEACNLNIPWCNNQQDFNANHYMTLVYGGDPAHPIAIWQSGDNVYWSANNQYPASGQLGGNYAGVPYSVGLGGSVVLIVDNRPWPVAILYRLS